ncbi:hypothetical protein BaRGS_00004638 [Batillaria attramentaria]|uniref:Uncharacterized protein n=1 Tax=Batillaria attramentaria TaxID=370345 RepID=A0ABD0LXG2_9CAEN
MSGKLLLSDLTAGKTELNHFVFSSFPLEGRTTATGTKPTETAVNAGIHTQTIQFSQAELRAGPGKLRQNAGPAVSVFNTWHSSLMLTRCVHHYRSGTNEQRATDNERKTTLTRKPRKVVDRGIRRCDQRRRRLIQWSAVWPLDAA